MIKRYCDKCGAEIAPKHDPDDAAFIIASDDGLHRARIEFLLTSNSADTSGEFCLPCVLYEVMRWVMPSPPPDTFKAITFGPHKLNTGTDKPDDEIPDDGFIPPD